jgi:hypothetical protein
VDTTSQVLLGVLAFSSLVQALVVLAAALVGWKLVKDLADVRETLDRRLTPVADHVSRVSRNVAEASDLLAAQSRRVDRAVDSATRALQDTVEYTGRAVRTGVRPLVEVGALWQGAKRALRVYRSFGPSPRPRSEETVPRDLGGPREVWNESPSGVVER